MSIPQVSGPALRVELPAAQARATSAIPRDQPFKITVVESRGQGRWVVDVAGQRVTAVTDLEVVAGDQLEVVATTRRGILELRLVGMTARLDQVRYDAATIAQAGGTLAAVALTPLAQRLLALLQALSTTGPGLPAGGDRPQVAATIADRLQPLDPRQGEAHVATRLQSQLAEGGLLLEARLRQWLETQSEPRGLNRQPGAETGLPGTVKNDLRALLAALATQLSSQPAAGALARANAVRADLAGLGSEILSNQLDLALQWLLTGQLQVQFPVAFHDQVRMADLRVHDRRDAARKARRRSGSDAAIDIRIDLGELGRLLARVRWAGTHVHARIYVERADVAELARAQAEEFSAGLTKAGFRTVEARVIVDPGRARQVEDRSPAEDAVGGAIFRARV